MTRIAPALLLLLFVAAACTHGGAFQAGTGESAPPEVISNFAVAPNPAAGKATVTYALHRDVSRVQLKFYSAAGDFVRGYDDLPARATAGAVDAAVWDLADFEGRPVPAGAYLARLVIQSGETVWRLTRTVAVP